MKKIFGYITIFRLKKHRNEYPFNDDIYKKRFLIQYVAPQWMWKWFEGISFVNSYLGTPEDSKEKSTYLVFSGSNNLYWIFFRMSPAGVGDWKWCLKFQKTDNDHIYCC